MEEAEENKQMVTKQQIEYKKTLIRWLFGVTIIILICVTIILVVTNTYTIRFEMDNNTLEAFKLINWSNFTNGN
jgi:hypothetical protein